jgi:hypothetical protein
MEAACHTFAITSGRAIKEDRDMRQDSNVNPNEGSIAKFNGGASGGVKAGHTMTLGYAAMPNSSAMKCAWPTASPLASHRTLPFRIMATVSIPCKVRQAL